MTVVGRKKLARSFPESRKSEEVVCHDYVMKIDWNLTCSYLRGAARVDYSSEYFNNGLLMIINDERVMI